MKSKKCKKAIIFSGILSYNLYEITNLIDK